MEESLEKLWESRYTWIAWREPLPVADSEGNDTKALACRFCIAMYGLKGSEIDKLPTSREEFDKHMREKHPR